MILLFIVYCLLFFFSMLTNTDKFFSALVVFSIFEPQMLLIFSKKITKEEMIKISVISTVYIFFMSIIFVLKDKNSSLNILVFIFLVSSLLIRWGIFRVLIEAMSKSFKQKTDRHNKKVAIRN